MATTPAGGEVQREHLLRPPEHIKKKKTLLIVGLGPGGLYVARELASVFQVVAVEPKDFYEFTPGILRGFADPRHLRKLQISLSEVLKGLGVALVRGEVVELSDGCCKIRATQDSPVQLGQEVPPQRPITLHFDLAVIASGSQYPGGTDGELWKVAVASGVDGDRRTSQCARVGQVGHTNAKFAELERAKGTAIVIGAGLVGVEMAAELAHFFPGLRVLLVGRAPQVLPFLPASAQRYAQTWLEEHGVQLRLGYSEALPLQAADPAAVAVDLGVEGPSLVLNCTGSRMRNSFTEPLGCLNDHGAVRVNLAMQVVRRCSLEQGSVDTEAVAGGRVFALGDCVTIDGVAEQPGKETYVAEAMAEVVVHNLQLVAATSDMEQLSLRKLSLPLNKFTVCSLGPNDAVFIINGHVVLKGWAAATVKSQIESTKIGQYRQKVWGSFIWKVVPHW